MRLEIPPNALRFPLRPYVRLIKRGVRVVDMKRSHQHEVLAEDVEYTCPICKTIQLAPPLNGVDYECPGCKYHYKVYDDLLCVWNPESLGVKTTALPPGSRPLTVADDYLSGDEDRAEALKQEAIRDWARRGQTDKPHTQIIVPERKDED
jgi:hypothetical protein